MVFGVGGCCGLIIHVDDFGYDDDGSCGGEIVGRGGGGGDGNSNYGFGNGSGSKAGDNDSDRGCGGKDNGNGNGNGIYIPHFLYTCFNHDAYQ